jgi:hypothetical protein
LPPRRPAPRSTSPSGNYNSAPLPPNKSIFHNWKGISAQHANASTSNVFYGGINGNLIGGVDCDEIVRFDANGAIEFNVYAESTAIGAFHVYGGTFTAASVIGPATGNIGLVRATSGNMSCLIQPDNGSVLIVTVDSGSFLGNIIAPLGSIRTISVPNGNIGSASVTPQIYAKNGFTTSIEAQRIWADMRANHFGGSGDVRTISTTVGDFSGSLWANNLGTTNANGLPIAGKLNATVLLMA